MKNLKSLISVILLIAFIISLSGCYGSFTLTKKVYNWNGKVGDKFLNTIVMWVFIIVPVYGACGFIDFVVLNTIEFWLGSNPLALHNSKDEIKVIKSDGKVYEVTMGNDRIKIKEIEGIDKGKEITLVFDPVEGSWYLYSDDGVKKIVEFDGSSKNLVKLFYPDGTTRVKTIEN